MDNRETWPPVGERLDWRHPDGSTSSGDLLPAANMLTMRFLMMLLNGSEWCRSAAAASGDRS